MSSNPHFLTEPARADILRNDGKLSLICAPCTCAMAPSKPSPDAAALITNRMLAAYRRMTKEGLHGHGKLYLYSTLASSQLPAFICVAQ